MFKKVLVLLLVLAGHFAAIAQDDSSTHLRVSLLTCGPGDEEIYEVFGHTGIRIIDSVQHTDVVYNYGTFSYGPDFEMQFMRGKLLYCVAVEPFPIFMDEYVQAHRKVEEQVLLLDWKKTDEVAYFLDWNAEPENKNYKYDFFFDNCATRIRDIPTRPEVFGKRFHYGNVLPPGKLTFRDIINQYFYRDHWTRVGVNILLGSKIDKVMTNADIMFLPDYLRDGFASATVDGKKIAAPATLLLPAKADTGHTVDLPLIVMCLVALLTIAGLSMPRLRVLGRIMSSLLLFVTGLLGCLILVMWFATDHQGCSDNFNILWCLPTNIVLAFFKPKGANRYALIAMILIFASLLLHVFKVQGLVKEFIPILLSLLCVFGTIYRQTNVKKMVDAA